MRNFLFILTPIFYFCFFAGFAYGKNSGPVPEIDPGLAPSALALLTCGLFILTDRVRRKK
jgi:hypothetical protein